MPDPESQEWYVYVYNCADELCVCVCVIEYRCSCVLFV